MTMGDTENSGTGAVPGTAQQGGASQTQAPPPRNAGPLEPAPYLSDIADGPSTGCAYWLTASDGVRIRVGLWPRSGARGTVVILPGRTEYIEKYGRAARELAERGYACIALDWRGQGLADRLGPQPELGHVLDFEDFQKDWDALAQALPHLTGPDLPHPEGVIAHSMGGGIALRTVLRGAIEAAGIRALVFTGPMWDIAMMPPLRKVARGITGVACALGMGTRYAPGTGGETYVCAADFEDNTLTTDRSMWDYMRGQINKHPELALSGPSMRWLDGALAAASDYSRAKAPELPALIYLGSNERIVSPDAIYSLIERWPNAELRLVEGGEHEVMMEGPQTQSAFFDAVARFFQIHTTGS